MFTCVYLFVHRTAVSVVATEGAGATVAGLTGSCELSDMGFGTELQDSGRAVHASNG